MKKITLILALMFTAFVAKAQDNESGVMLDINLAGMQYTNWSAVSVFDDGGVNQTYGLFNADQITLSYLTTKGYALGIGLGWAHGNAPRFDETFRHITVSFEFSDTYKITDRFSAETGLSIAYLNAYNEFEINDNTYNVTRNGWLLDVSTGLRFNILSDQYIGFRIDLPCFGGLEKAKLPDEVPATIEANNKTDLFGYRIGFTYGIVF